MCAAHRFASLVVPGARGGAATGEELGQGPDSGMQTLAESALCSDLDGIGADIEGKHV